MNNKIQLHKLPSLQELYSNPEEVFKTDKLTTLLNQQPQESWIKVHPFIKNYRYLPIDKIEFLLKRIFKSYRIEILREGTSFNGVYVVVRVHYLNPITEQWDYHDGIGAIQLQTSSGKSPADLVNINNGALSMAFPIAKTIAIKDACDHFGALFGSDLNRKDTIQYSLDSKLENVVLSKAEERLSKLIDSSETIEVLEGLKDHLTENLQEKYNKRWMKINSK